jgi:hypothetical protein
VEAGQRLVGTQRSAKKSTLVVEKVMFRSVILSFAVYISKEDFFTLFDGV